MNKYRPIQAGKNQSSMKTVEAAQKAETFETAMESARKLNLSLKQFLIAFPEFTNPISEDRLRELLDSATKESIPYLWGIYAAYKCLEALKDDKDYYKRLKDAIEWRISGVVKKELEANPPQDVPSAKFLRDAAPEGTSAQHLAEDQFVIQLTRLIDNKRTLEQLVEDRKLFPEKYPIRNELDALICKKANERLSGKLTPTKRFECIELVGDSLPGFDKVKGLESLVSDKTSVHDLCRASKMLVAPSHGTVEFEAEKLRGRIWAIIIKKTSDRELWWQAALFGSNSWVWEKTCMSARLKILKTSPSFQELLKMFLETGSGIVHDYRGVEYHREVLDLLVSQFRSVLTSTTKAEEDEIRKAYETVAVNTFRFDRHKPECWWQVEMRSLLIRRLYELQNPSQSS